MGIFDQRRQQLGVSFSNTPQTQTQGESIFDKRRKELEGGGTQAPPSPVAPPDPWDEGLQNQLANGPFSNYHPQQQPMTPREKGIQARENDPSNPVLKFIKDNTVDAFSSAIDKFQYETKPGQFIGRIGQAGQQAMGLTPKEEFSTGSKIADTVADVGGSVAGYFTNPSAVGMGQSFNAFYNNPLTQRAASAVGAKLSGNFGRAATEATREGLSAAAYAVPRSAITGDEDVAQNVAVEGAIGAAGGALIGGLSKPVRTALEKLMGRSRQPEAVQEILALPEGRPRGNPNRAETPDVINAQGEVTPLGLPEPNMLPPTTARVARRANPYRDKYEALIAEANQQQFTPGRELEELEELWGRMADVEDPGLDELINLAYPRQTNRLAPDLVQRAKETQRKRDVYGVGLPVRSQADRYQGFVGEAALPRTEPRGLGAPFRQEAAAAADQIDTPTKPSADLPDEDIMKYTFDPSDSKDISGFDAQTRDVYRNMEAVMGKEAAAPYLGALDDAKKENIDMQEYWLGRLKKEVVDGLGIKKGSKESALVQQYGEGQITLDELKRRAPENWKKIVKADNFFRQAYDNLIDIVNESRMQIYGNNTEKLVPKRKDYYRHFRDVEGLAGLKNLFETPAQIDPGLSGLSEFVKPKSRFAGFMQKRGLGSFKNDAVGGFLEYIPSASYASKIDPVIGTFRELGNSIAEFTGDSKNLNNFIEYLNDFANDLSGKTNAADRFIQKVIPGGRRTMGLVNWINNRVKANTILGNVSSLLAQTGNIPNGIAATKQYAVPGAAKTMLSIFDESITPAKESAFLKERYFNTREFNTRLIEQPMKFAGWAIETMDKMGTRFIWNSAYEKAVAEGVKEPIKYADDLTRKMVAGRGVGESPLLQKSKAFQLIAPFQLEVGNAINVMRDFTKEKDIGALATLFVTSYALNKAMEELRGSGIVFDPIQAIIDASEKDLTPQQRVGRIGGEILSNIPLGQSVATMFPQYGGNVLGVPVPSREELFGDNDPTRFGSGLLAAQAITDPLTKVALPLGGSQVKKTTQGATSLIKGEFEKDGKLRFPVEPTGENITRGLLFGPYQTEEGRRYIDEERRPLSENQTQQLKSLPQGQQSEYYEYLNAERRVNSIEAEANKVIRDQALSNAQKQKKLEALAEARNKVILQLQNP